MAVTLIIGRHDDPHTEAVTLALKRLDKEVVHFDTYRQDFLELRFSSLNQVEKKLKLSDYFGDDIDSIWLRQKPIVPAAWWSPLEHDAARFAQSEWRNIIQTLSRFVPTQNWINHPESQRIINYKPNQLEIALSVGFIIPETVITNDPETVKSFLVEHEKVIYKSLSGYIFSDQTGILTTLLSLDKLESGYDSIKKAPGIYQKFIEKDYEIRVVVIGSKHFVSRIETPKDGLGAIDWRHSHFDDIFREGSMPNEIALCINKFQKIANIHYGAYDFIVSPNGQWYFLECNPAGQFLWLENALGYNISKAIAEYLCIGINT